MTEWAWGSPGPCWDPTKALLSAELSVLSPPGNFVGRKYILWVQEYPRGCLRCGKVSRGPLGPAVMPCYALRFLFASLALRTERTPPWPDAGKTLVGVAEKKEVWAGKATGFQFPLNK